jgi:hypothetical protein
VIRYLLCFGLVLLVKFPTRRPHRLHFMPNLGMKWYNLAVVRKGLKCGLHGPVNYGIRFGGPPHRLPWPGWASETPNLLARRFARYKDATSPPRFSNNLLHPFPFFNFSARPLQLLFPTEMHEISSAMLSYTPAASCSPKAFRISGNAMSL